MQNVTCNVQGLLDYYSGPAAIVGAIDWPVCEACVLVSEKDQKGATLCDAEAFA